MTLNGPFRPHFSLCSHAQVISCRTGSQELFPQGWRQQDIPHQSVEDALLSWHWKHRGLNHSRQSERGSEMIGSTPWRDTELVSRGMPAKCLQSVTHLSGPTPSGPVLGSWGHTAHYARAGAQPQVSCLPRPFPVDLQPRTSSRSFCASWNEQLEQGRTQGSPTCPAGVGMRVGP